MSGFWNYRYYDTPEGHDIYKKLFVTSKYAGLTGFVFATHDVLMYSHPKGVAQTVGRYAFFLGPMLGMAAAFTVTTNVAQNIRGKNDKLNYFLGGAAAGTIVGAWTRSGAAVLPAAFILGCIAVVKKIGVDEGWQFVPDVQQADKTIQSWRNDWTWAKDIPELKTWTTGKE